MARGVGSGDISDSWNSLTSGSFELSIISRLLLQLLYNRLPEGRRFRAWTAILRPKSRPKLSAKSKWVAFARPQDRVIDTNSEEGASTQQRAETERNPRRGA